MNHTYLTYPEYTAPQFSSVKEMIDKCAEKYPDVTAYIYKKNPNEEKTTEVTFSEVRTMVSYLGTQLLTLGMRGVHCALIGELSLYWILSYFSILSIDAVVVPIDKYLNEKEMMGLISHSDCKFIFYSNSISKKIQNVLSHLHVDTTVVLNANQDENSIIRYIQQGKKHFEKDSSLYNTYRHKENEMAEIVFTSGTTGKSKGVVLTQENVIRNTIEAIKLVNLTDRTICVLPPHHSLCSTISVICHYCQGISVFISSGLKYIHNELLNSKPKHLLLVPLFIEEFYSKILYQVKMKGEYDKFRKLLYYSKENTPSISEKKALFPLVHNFFGGELQFIISGGAALSQEIIDDFFYMGLPILNGYGITECSPLVSCNRNESQVPGSVGIPLQCLNVKISGSGLENEIGEICVKGPTVTCGYYKDDSLTQTAFDKDGFYLTGDLGKIDKKNNIYIVGRKKNVIVLSNGENVCPEELEGLISIIPGVNEVVVHEGESSGPSASKVIICTIVADGSQLPQMTESEIKTYFMNQVGKINKTLVRYKRISNIVIRNEPFPRNSSHKIIRER